MQKAKHKIQSKMTVKHNRKKTQVTINV